MASTPSGHGYWLVTNYGRSSPTATPVCHVQPAQKARARRTGYDWFAGITAAPAGGGFWAVRYGGQTYAYGATYLGNVGAHTGRIMGIAGTTNQGGYVLMDTTGQQYAYGNAVYVDKPAPRHTAQAGHTAGAAAGRERHPAGGRAPGNPVTNYTEPCAGDPVNCESGDLWETDTDVTVPGDGPHLDLTRSYNSQDDRHKGRLRLRLVELVLDERGGDADIVDPGDRGQRVDGDLLHLDDRHLRRPEGHAGQPGPQHHRWLHLPGPQHDNLRLQRRRPADRPRAT